jgi:hypothetical protein
MRRRSSRLGWAGQAQDSVSNVHFVSLCEHGQPAFLCILGL